MYEALVSYRYPVHADFAEEDTEDILSIEKLIVILSSVMGVDLSEEIENGWANISVRPFQAEIPATKREIAILLDRFLNPFKKAIDHNGRLI